MVLLRDQGVVQSDGHLLHHGVQELLTGMTFLSARSAPLALVILRLNFM